MRHPAHACSVWRMDQLTRKAVAAVAADTSPGDTITGLIERHHAATQFLADADAAYQAAVEDAAAAHETAAIKARNERVGMLTEAAVITRAATSDLGAGSVTRLAEVAADHSACSAATLREVITTITRGDGTYDRVGRHLPAILAASADVLDR